MADDPLSALEEISYLRACIPAIAAAPEAFDLEELMPRLGRALAAADAALKEHLRDERETGWCAGCGHSWPCATARAITRELTGEAAMARLSRAEVRRLYGCSRVPRSHRRFMAALLNNPGASYSFLSGKARTRPGTVSIVLERMSKRGWVTASWYDAWSPKYYELTEKGCAAVRLLLGLEAGDGH